MKPPNDSDGAKLMSALPLDSELQRVVSEMTANATASKPRNVWRKGPLFDPARAVTSLQGERGRFWRRFRKAYPFGIQGVAVSAIGAKGTCSVVVAEPPPHLSLADLRAIVPNVTVCRRSLGHDGALFDAVGTLSGGKVKINEALRQLNVLLYRTDYKSFVYKEPFRSNPINASAYRVNVKPTTEELLAWVSANDTKYSLIGSGQKIGYEELRQRRNSVVAIVPGQGLIAWWIPKGTAFENCLVQARQFALESDLIVGGVEAEGLLLCGRRRVAPYDVLPPLRAETIALLASVKDETELFQTYNDGGPGAGEYDRDWNWSSILMSSQLIDTEYGNLLNVADQAIKDWTEAGRIVDNGFQSYPQPRDFPFNNVPLLNIVKDKLKESALTFNWNTKGSGHAVDYPSAKVYSPGATGSLSVSYIPGEDPTYGPKMVPFEEEGFRFFATQGDATIARVAQYTAIYQIFHNLSGPDVSETAPEVKGVDEALDEGARAMVAAIDGYSSSDIPRLVKLSPISERLSRLGKVLNAGYLPMSLEKGIEAWKGLSREEKAAITPREMPSTISPEIERSLSLLMSLAARDIREPERIVRETKPGGSSWVHTQTVAMTNAGPLDPTLIGGHNLDAELKTFQVAADLRPGQVRIAADGTVAVSKSDVAKLPSLQRKFDRGTSRGETIGAAQARLQSLLKRSETSKIRPANAAIGPRKPAPEDAGFASSSVRRLDDFEYTIPKDVEAAFAGAEDDIMVFKSGDYYYVGGRGIPPVPTNHPSDAAELVAGRLKTMTGGSGGGSGGEPPSVGFKGFPDDDGWPGMWDDVRRRAGKNGIPADVFAVIGGGRKPKIDFSSYDLSNQKIVIGAAAEQNGTNRVTIAYEMPAKTASQPGATLRTELTFPNETSPQRIDVVKRAVATKWVQLCNGYRNGQDLIRDYASGLNELRKRHKIGWRLHLEALGKQWRLSERHRYGAARVS